MRVPLTVTIAMLTACACTQIQPLGDAVIHANQIGFYPGSAKEFVVENPVRDTFEIIDVVSGKTVFTGRLDSPRSWEPAGKEPFAKGNFSDLKIPGRYFIQYGGTKSHEFVIQEHLYSEVLAASMKAFYFQRASQALPAKYAGSWARAAGHPDVKLPFHPDMKRQGTLDSPGGWYDAGDYGKYVVNAGITMLTLMMAWELEPAVMLVPLNIPESGSVSPLDIIKTDSSQFVPTPDFIHELKYELDWFITMQDSDGGVFFKIGPTTFPSFILPDVDIAKRFVIGKSTTSTLNFAATMAMAGECFAQYMPSYAGECARRAARAWEWAWKNPAVGEPSEIGGTGAYGDKEYKDEFLAAAAQLFITTGDDRYKQYLLDHIKSFSIDAPAAWATLGNFAFFSLAMRPENLPADIKDFITGKIISFADLVLSRMKENPLDVPMTKENFIWGSNGVIMNYGMTVAMAGRITGEQKYRSALPSILDYIFGKNATGFSFVTGFGEKSPMLPHHRPSGAGKSIEPVPGLLVGGPNKDMEDGSAFYIRTEPARAYADRQGSYASNEVAINWNAPLVFMLAMAEAELK